MCLSELNIKEGVGSTTITFEHLDDREQQSGRERSLSDHKGVPIVSHGGFLHSFSSFIFYVRCIVVMEAEEPDLTLETVASTLMKKKVCQLGEKFGFAIDVLLEVPGEDE